MPTSLDHGVVNSFLRGPRYPLSRDELVNLAKENRESPKFIEALSELPPRDYGSQEEVMEQLERMGHHIT